MKETKKDIVIGLDSSTQSSKAIAWDVNGKLIAEGRADIALDQSQSGYAEQTTTDWWRSACTALKELAKQIEMDRVIGIGISNQRETVGFFDANYVETHPAVTWLDDRSLEEIPNSTSEFGADRIHNITGRPPFDATVAMHSISWMKRNRPDVWKKTSKFLDVHGYLTKHLTGRAVASTTSIDAFSVYNIKHMRLSHSILDYLGLSPDNFADIQKPGTLAGTVNKIAADATGLPEGLPVFVGGGDGQCAGLGVRCISPGSIFLNLGTAIIAGTFTKDPWISQHWRTVTSPTGEGYYLEGCQRAGTFLIDWLCENIGGRNTSANDFKTLEKAASQLAIGSDGVTMSPYLMGCMDPHWDRDARASFHGLSPDHNFTHLFRASLEATALQIARYVKAISAEGMNPKQIIAVGGGSSNKLWTQMISDATGLAITQCQSREASSLGAAISAAVGLNWFDSFEAASDAMVSFGNTIKPDISVKAQWDTLSSRQALTYTS